MSGNPSTLRDAMPGDAPTPGDRARREGHHSGVCSFRHRASRWLVHRGLRSLLAVYAALMRLASLVGPPKRPVGRDGYEILLTGTFYSDNWVMSHVRPLAMAKRCARVGVVSTYPVPPMNKVEAIYPPAWLLHLLGAVPARLLTFIWTAVRRRPHVVGGFHLLVNGLVAALLARLIGSRSLYFSVGGPSELLDGGLSSENRLFKKLETPDPVVERRLLRAVASFDLVITMGTRTISFFRERGIGTTFRVVSGGLDAGRFRPAETAPTVDLILVGRLVPVKRIDLFLQAIRHIREVLPHVTAAVVGDGPLRPSLEQLARELGIEHHLTFVGRPPSVESWLRRAKVFVLTSDTEALSLALMEAMLCGLPGVVSKVGDLGDLVEHGVNGYLVSDRTPEAFAARLVELLTDPVRLARFAAAARRSAERYEIGAVSGLWDEILALPESPGQAMVGSHATASDAAATVLHK